MDHMDHTGKCVFMLPTEEFARGNGNPDPSERFLLNTWKVGNATYSDGQTIEKFWQL